MGVLIKERLQVRKGVILGFFLQKTREEVRLPEICLFIFAQAHTFHDSSEAKLGQWILLGRATDQRIVSPEIIEPGHLGILKLWSARTPESSSKRVTSIYANGDVQEQPV